MFASSLSLSLPSSLASHVFGRFASSAAPTAMPVPMSGSVAALHARNAATEVDDGEEEFDLAQRVRDVGEW
jgi:hypothetical protein